ncbi:MAG: sigma-70 family RNA polymerase sigma factor [Armatimonadetes bacterium]|nr:sigma-70 family RNA polymerase sigma factor [Armatimonadota bacterium]MDE2205041.1 sigma-70 family RNA polymerase sigma factor [Armatimonadota bacterium]
MPCERTFIEDRDKPAAGVAHSTDPAIFQALWDRHWPAQYRFFRRRGLRAEEAEDLAGETLLAAFANLHQFEGRGRGQFEGRSCSVETWLGSIARRKLAAYLAGRSRLVTIDSVDGAGVIDAGHRGSGAGDHDRLPGDSANEPIRALLKRELAEETCDALISVGMRSETQFAALLLHYCCDLSHKDIAELWHVDSKTVNSRLQEGRKSLKRAIAAPLDG